MTTYYVIKSTDENASVVAKIVTSPGDITYLPILRGTDVFSISVLDERQVDALVANLDMTPGQILAAMNLVDNSGSMLQSLILAPQGIGELAQIIDGTYHVLLTIGAYKLWQVNASSDNLIAVHDELWAMSPIETLGLVAIVQTFDVSFFPLAVKNNLGWDNPTWLARRNTIATYMNNHGGDGTEVAAATDEDTLAKGIATGMGYTVSQLWNAMN
jgi:hypothetical protein